MDLKKHIDILCCPDCRGNLSLFGEKLKCDSCEREFLIKDGIPILLPLKMSKEVSLAIESFGSEYKELIDSDNLYYEDKYCKKDIELITNNEHRINDYLEIGCGRERNCIALAKRGVGFVVGADASIDALVLAKKISEKEKVLPLFVCCDIMNLPFKERTFDVCFGGGSLEHFPDTSKGIGQIHMVLKDKGLSIMTVPCVSLATCAQGMITGNIPKIPVLKDLYFFIHHKLLKGRYLVFGFEYSFLPSGIRKEFKVNGFGKVRISLYDVDYDFKFVPNFLKVIAKRLIRHRLFWPMIVIKCRKSLPINAE